jgi:hypothetical protein
MDAARPLVLLGPQRFVPLVDAALEPLAPAGAAVAAITAGWEERETEDRELGAHVQRTVHNLELHRRMDAVREGDPELVGALRARRDELAELQKLYRLQMRHLGRAAEDLLRRNGPIALLEPERAMAIQNMHALDDHRLARVCEIDAAFLERWKPHERPAVAAHRRELEQRLNEVGALCVAGGHVEALWNCLWLFDVVALLPPTLPIVGWSAGAMVLAERIVLFHDSPPQGRGYAEVWGPGFGLARGVVPLPPAARRLQLEDPVRVQLLSRRFADALCVTLDDGARLVWDGSGWSGSTPTRRLTVAGALGDVGGSR